ncbi:MAG: glutathione-disulfide reductase [Rhodospirillales bacterium RIFCSPLOWO2_12_FULL_58_28]|nr:MAG: glutathione-disulfide reductase [Rhodospirillales bacterium RIFCSPLOWO2_12_FULL_58_28]
MATKKYDYDLICIGAGSGGVRASRMAAQFGAKVAIIEESRVGGTCVIRGCVAKKLLVYGAHFADDFKDAAGYGWTVGETDFDWARLVTAKNREIDRLNGIYVNMLRANGVDIIEGRGVLADAHTVEAAGKTLTAGHILIAVGSWPTIPRIPGIEHVITSNEALDLMSLPKRMVIVGAGYIAVEFAGIFNALGVEVTEILRADKVLRGFDDDLRKALGEEMGKHGVNLMVKTVVDSIDKTGGGYTLNLHGGDVVKADLVMYATGRAPKTSGLGLKEAGIKLNDKGAVEVDEYSRSSRKSVFAVGDATDRMNLTPVAIAEGAAVAQTLFNDNPTTVDYANIPTAVFSQPPLGTVGLTEEQARVKHKNNVDIYISRFKPMKHSLSGRDEKTLMKLVVNSRTDRVLGCHMLGMDAPEIMQGLGIALKCKARKSQFDATVGIHPSAAEEFVTMRTRSTP